MKKNLVLVLLFLFAVTAAAQTGIPSSAGAGASQYVLGNSDEVLMPVNVWGFVGKPGQYMVPYKTDLVSLLSYAGGPLEEAKIKSIRVVRSGKNGEEGQVIEVNVKDFIEKGSSDLIPVLEPGDTIVVSGTTFNFVRNSLQFVVQVAALAQIYAIIEYYTARAND